LHYFRDIAFDRFKITIFPTPLVFNSTDGGVPWDDLRKIFIKKSQMAKVPNGVETLQKISIAGVGRTNGQTDDRQKQTDGRQHIANVCS